MSMETNGQHPPTPSVKVAVVGCGVLGTSLCRQLLSLPEFQAWSVTALTKTTNRHDSITNEVGHSDRFQVLTWDDVPNETTKFDHVVFCAPPHGFEDFAGAIDDAATKLWDGPSKGGCFIYTSSGGIYGPGVDGEAITETSPTADPSSSPRMEGLVKAEEACGKHGGCCLRFGGLYNLERGTHAWYLPPDGPKEMFNVHPDGLINQLHYDDAAMACIAALRCGPGVVQGKNFLLSDGHPMSRRDICACALQLKHFSDQYSMPQFTGQKTKDGKVDDASVTNDVLKWFPKYASFGKFIEALAVA